MRFFVFSALVLATAVPAVAAPKSPPRKQAPVKKAAASAFRSLQVLPANVTLNGAGARQSLLVTGTPTAGLPQDLTGAAIFTTSNPKVAVVDKRGVVSIVGSGAASILVSAGGIQAKVPVRASNPRADSPLTFANDVAPVLGRAGCYQAACHAKQGGKNGFQLSVLAFDLEADYAAVVRQADGRRINRIEPERSLLLTKATLAVPHAGGQRIRLGSPEYDLLARWIAEGAPEGVGAPELTKVEVEPAERVMAPRKAQRLLATAVYSDGRRRDVSSLAQYATNESAIAEVGEDGIVRTTPLAGEAALTVRYMGKVAVVRISVPQPGGARPARYDGFPKQNFVDPLVYRKLAQLNLLPSDGCDDATFLRRAYLDLIGTLPTPEETTAFLSECSVEVQGEGKAVPSSPSAPALQHSNTPALKARARLVDRLLDRPEYADYWGMRWANLLLVNPDLLLPRGAFAFDRWIREAFRTNMRFDRFATEILTSSGETYREGPPNFFRALPNAPDAGKAVSQLFLGVRIDCAQCHHHPFERWGQDDFYSMAAFFAQVKSKSSYPEGYHSIVYAGSEGEVKHPKTDAVMPPRPLGGAVANIPAGADRRESLARWLTAPDNPYFARAIVNRMWALLMGRGLVEPVDDFRMTNPSVNEPLLDALAKDFVASGFDLKHLFRTIAGSAAYQRSSRSTPNNAKDMRNYSRFITRRLPAEVLLDALDQTTEVRQTYRGHPEGTRAIAMWDSRLDVEFLDVFGRPVRQSVCECERSSEGSVTQMLHLMNSDSIHRRLTHDDSAAARLDKSGKPPDELVTQIYLTCYSRQPTAEERQLALAAFTREKVTRRQAIEDLMWAMLNSAEFLLNH